MNLFARGRKKYKWPLWVIYDKNLDWRQPWGRKWTGQIRCKSIWSVLYWAGSYHGILVQDLSLFGSSYTAVPICSPPNPSGLTFMAVISKIHNEAPAKGEEKTQNHAGIMTASVTQAREFSIFSYVFFCGLYACINIDCITAGYRGQS